MNTHTILRVLTLLFIALSISWSEDEVILTLRDGRVMQGVYDSTAEKLVIHTANGKAELTVHADDIASNEPVKQTPPQTPDQIRLEALRQDELKHSLLLPVGAEEAYIDAQGSIVQQYKDNLDKLVKALETQRLKETKNGNLDKAVAVDSLIKDVKSGKLLKDFVCEVIPADVVDKPNDIVVPADSAVRVSTNAKIHADQYRGLVWSVGPDGWYQYAVNLPQTADYYLYVLMTSKESRPCLLFNDSQAIDQICGDTTGSFLPQGLAWFKYGPYHMRDGAHTLEIHAQGNSPHLRGFVLSKSNHLELNKTIFGPIPAQDEP